MNIDRELVNEHHKGTIRRATLSAFFVTVAAGHYQTAAPDDGLSACDMRLRARLLWSCAETMGIVLG